MEGMDGFHVWQYWLAAGALFFILEIVTPGTFFMWLGAAAFALAGITALVDLPVVAELLIFGALAAAGVFLWRRYGPKEKPQTVLLNQRGQEYVGRTFVLTEAIANGVGRAKVGDTVWRVTGPEAPLGAQVKVTGVEGATLVVEKVN